MSQNGNAPAFVVDDQRLVIKYQGLFNQARAETTAVLARLAMVEAAFDQVAAELAVAKAALDAVGKEDDAGVEEVAEVDRQG